MGKIIKSYKIDSLNFDEKLENKVFDILANENIKDKDIIAINENVLSIYEGNIVNIEKISDDVKSKINSNSVGLVFPVIFNCNFETIFRAIAKSMNSVVVLLSYPYDEVYNETISNEKLIMNDINVSKDMLEYDNKYFKEVIEGYKRICDEESSQLKVIFCNKPEVILEFVDNIIVCNIHDNNYTYERLIAHGAVNIIKISDILNEKNSKYGLIGSKYYNDYKISLISRNGDNFVNNLQKLYKEKINKNIEILIYGNGSYKNPENGVWRLNNTTIGISYTKGLEGRNKNSERYIDLIGSICDLLDEDKDSIILIQNYFD